MSYFETHGRELRYYETAMVCENGHTITDGIEQFQEMKAAFCPTCGAKTLTTCPTCEVGIRGHYSGGSPLSNYEPPTFCYNCGKPFPWTRASIRAWRELVRESEGLSAEETERLAGSIDDLIADTPNTDVAVVRVKKWLAKAGNIVGPSVRQIIVSVGTETVKKAMGL